MTIAFFTSDKSRDQAIPHDLNSKSERYESKHTTVSIRLIAMLEPFGLTMSTTVFFATIEPNALPFVDLIRSCYPARPRLTDRIIYYFIDSDIGFRRLDGGGLGEKLKVDVVQKIYANGEMYFVHLARSGGPRCL